MKKEKIYNIIVACVSFILLFLPVYPIDNGYMFTISVFFIAHNYLPGFALRESLIFTIGCISIILLVIHIIKPTFKLKISATACSFMYVIMWLIGLFARFSYRNTYRDSIISELNYGANIIWIIIYFVMLLAIIALSTLQYFQYLSHRRPTKTERMQAQIDELQKQVDELKKGE